MHMEAEGEAQRGWTGTEQEERDAPTIEASVCPGQVRFIEWFGLEGTFKGHLVQPPTWVCVGQVCVSLPFAM